MYFPPQLKMTDQGSHVGLYAGVTLRGSYANGYAFIDATSVSFAGYVGRRIQIADSLGNIATGWIKSQGTGETLGSELVTNGDFQTWYARAFQAPYAGTWILGGYGTELVRASLSQFSGYCGYVNGLNANGSIIYQPLAVSVAGTMLKYSIKGVLYSTGSSSYPTIRSTAAVGSPNIGQITATGSSYTTLAGYLTHTSSTAYIVLVPNYGSYYDDVTIKQVTAPSSSGVRIVSTQGGTTYNWESNSGMTFNAATYSVTIFT